MDLIQFLEDKFSQINSPTENKKSNNNNNNKQITHSRTMSYSQYKQLREFLPPNFRHYLSSFLFLQISGPNLHNIQPYDLFTRLRITSRCVSIFQDLHSLDPLSTGSISISDFSNFIEEHAKSIHEVIQEGPNFLQQYVNVILQRFLLILDPLNTKRINLNQLFFSSLFVYFLNFENFSDLDSKNPVGVSSVLSVLKEFNRLDSDHDGLLQSSDFKNPIGQNQRITFTDAFIQRVFEYFPKTDLNWFIQFRFSWDKLGEPWANRFFFELMDINNDNYFGSFEINYFYMDMVKKFQTEMMQKLYSNYVLPSLDSFMNESLDISSITDFQISKKQFEVSKPLTLFLRHLVDLHSFISWESPPS